MTDLLLARTAGDVHTITDLSIVEPPPGRHHAAPERA